MTTTMLLAVIAAIFGVFAIALTYANLSTSHIAAPGARPLD